MPAVPSPANPVLFSPPRVLAEARPDGSRWLRSATPLRSYARSVGALFRAGAASWPDRVLAGQRGATGWRTVTWGAAREAVDGLAQALVDRGLADRPVMILSGNSVEHLLLTLAGHAVGAPVAPVSTAYSLLSRDHDKLRAMADLVDPGLIFVDDRDAYGPALEALRGPGRVVAGPGPSGEPQSLGFDELAATRPGAAVAERAAGVGPDTVAKYLFTSGSTGRPKAVINTHRMLCSNQQMMRQVWPFLAEEPPVLLDWLPWSHTFGGNHNLNMVLANGGTVWIDDGRPAPALLERTLRNLAEVSPTIYFNVPAGYALLVPALERDRELARRFFSRLRLVFFAASALPQGLWDRIEALSSSVGRSVPMTTSWGATETAPAGTSAHYRSGRADCIGVPLPGVEIKLVPVGDKTELRTRGPNVTPGYHRDPDRTRAAFDEDGFHRSGDAVCLVDPADPTAGLRFNGRIAEDFKLATGTWVSVGTLRPALVDASDGLLQDAVLVGHDGPYVAALAWLNGAQARALAGPGDGDPSALQALPAVRRACQRALYRLNRGAEGTSQQVRRLLLVAELPSLDDGEITDKGYVNQRAVLDRRAALVARLLADPPDGDVICWEAG